MTMNPRVRQAIIFILFILALAYGIVNLTGNRSNTKADSQNPTPVAAVPAKPIERTIDTAEYRAMEWGADPFYRAGTQAISSVPVSIPRQWNLDGILYDPVSPAAIINNQIVHAGETVDGAQIKKINRNSVILDNNGNVVSLNLEKDKI
jgi:type II secretory pathway component PulC